MKYRKILILTKCRNFKRIVTGLEMLCVHCRRLLTSALLRPATRTRVACIPAAVTRSYSLLPDSISALTQKRRDYSDQTIIGYTPDEVYGVVSDVNNYKRFLPWCKESSYIREGSHRSIARLVVGFPPLLETYTALVIHDPPNSMRTISTDGRLFTHLENLWQFRSGPDTDTGPTCIINFWVRFEFRSLLYAQLGNLVFDEIARKMSQSFESRCQDCYGPDHLKMSERSWQQLQRRLAQSRTTEPCEPS